jgi:hypothetical protein
VFAVYRSSLLPDVSNTLAIWRDEARKQGLELYLCCFETNGIDSKQYLHFGFDAVIDFQPVGNSLAGYNKWQTQQKQKRLYDRLKHYYFKKMVKPLNKTLYELYLQSRKIVMPTSLDYEDFVNYCISSDAPDYKCFPCVSPMWDNSARRKTEYFILKNATPQVYKKWLVDVVKKFHPYSAEENFIFINAWNEWAEGNHLEPCQKWGAAYLEATRDAINGTGY